MSIPDRDLVGMVDEQRAKAMARAFGQAVKSRREKRGIAQERFAFTYELDRTFVGGIERGERNPSLETVRRIARGLGISMTALVRDVERILHDTEDGS